jgi:hypothetical protein
MKPWNALHTSGRITRPLRHNGIAYSGINTLMLWVSAMEQGFAAPIWMTFKQAIELNAHVREGEKGSLVVYANSITNAEDDGTGNEVEREIPFMKGYTVFNVEQIEGLPERYYSSPQVQLTTVERIERAEAFFANTRYRGDPNGFYHGITVTHAGRTFVLSGPMRSLSRQKRCNSAYLVKPGRIVNAEAHAQLARDTPLVFTSSEAEEAERASAQALAVAQARNPLLRAPCRECRFSGS